jgi:catechol 2,3-dioxygenase-like lactoylglutathione lyase family enzyme
MRIIWILFFTIIAGQTFAQDKSEVLTKNNISMTYQDVYPVFVTKDLKACKEFYSRWFDFQIVFESGFFIFFSSTGERPCSIAFIDEVHPSSPPSNPAMNAQAGVFLTLQVADAKSDYERLKEAGLNIHYHLADEPWGQRRFGVIDPNGMYIDVVEQIEPQAGFWDKYPPKN